MFSTDKNIETIGQLVEVLKHYIGLQNEYLRLDVIEKVVRLITALTIAAVAFLIIIIIFIYLSFAAADAMAPALGHPVAFLIVAAVRMIFTSFVIFSSLTFTSPVRAISSSKRYLYSLVKTKSISFDLIIFFFPSTGLR